MDRKLIQRQLRGLEGADPGDSLTFAEAPLFLPDNEHRLAEGSAEVDLPLRPPARDQRLTAQLRPARLARIQLLPRSQPPPIPTLARRPRPPKLPSWPGPIVDTPRVGEVRPPV
ncbi:MAG: hypothetical protein KJO07_21375, partial [Deltaproteobacteria bacterium]|nr:hypothetical protein [Deltaproteobacteria bacterium]